MNEETDLNECEGWEEGRSDDADHLQLLEGVELGIIVDNP